MLQRLAVTLAMVSLADYEQGQVQVTGHGWNGHGYDSLTIDRADPTILITGPLLRQMATAHGMGALGGHVTITGDTLTIHGANRTVVYRILCQHPEQRDVWLACWPTV